MDHHKIPQSVIDHARSDVVSVVSQYVDLVKNGTEFHACCPFHKERTPSFTVAPAKGMYYCFGCGAGGDPIDFVMNYQGVGFAEAVRTITGEIPINPNAPAQAAAMKTADEWQPMMPVPESAPQPPNAFGKRFDDKYVDLPVVARWAFRDQAGHLLGYTCRVELPNGGKDVIPQTYCVSTATGEMKWRWKSFDKPRPMYGLDKIAQYPGAQVMVVEGEKTADFGQQLFINAGVPMASVITVAWAGGAKAIRFTDWSPLAGRKVGLWPDADLHDYGDNHPLAGQRMHFLHQPGTSAMMAIFDEIAQSAAVVKFIIPPVGPEYKCGWDLADAQDGWPILQHLRDSSIPAIEVRDRFIVPAPATPEEPEYLPPAEDTPPWEGEEHNFEPADEAPASSHYDPDEFSESLVKNGYFTILGYDQDEYYFFSHEKRQVLSRKAGHFSDTGLAELAPVQWWEMEFPGEKGGMNRKMAVNWIFRTANSRGIYDPSRVRGRGAWLDRSRHVFHLGNFLMVDGKSCDITKIDSGYVYPMARKTLDPALDAMTDDEGRWLASVAAKARWTSQSSAALIAGFVMLSPICGALKWRPHIWISGSAGTGKSTVQTKFVGGLTRGIHVHANGNSTEAGIRQELKADALPVLVDEFESNNERERQRVENVMSMIRQTSTETQARTLKGTVTGESQHYQIRSMFCLASINTNLPTKADVDRLTVLGMRTAKPGEPDNWDELEADLNKIDMDDEISSRLLARALGMMPTIIETVNAFRRVAAVRLGRQRDADQYGTLLAGYWCLMNSVVPTDDEIVAVLDDQQWDEHMENSDSDESGKVLDAILNARIRLGQIDYTVFEMIRATSLRHRQIADPEAGSAMDALLRAGIRPEIGAGELWFGVTVRGLAALVKDLTSITDLRGQLLRLNGAKRINPQSYMGVKSRGVAIPLWPMLEDVSDEPVPGAGYAGAYDDNDSPF